MNSDQTSNRNSLFNSDIVKLYEVLRSYLEHEDKLIHERVSRTLLVHGFLIASYVLLLQARIEVVAKCVERQGGCKHVSGELPAELTAILPLSDMMLPVIAIIGILTTRAARTGVEAAFKAADAVKLKWIAATQQFPDTANLVLPGIAGGGNKEVVSAGDQSVQRLLLSLLIMWWIILAIALISLVVWNSAVVAEWLVSLIQF